MAELTAATPGTSGGDRPVGHWGWENFFLLESVAATIVATRSTIWFVPCRELGNCITTSLVDNLVTHQSHTQKSLLILSVY